MEIHLYVVLVPLLLLAAAIFAASEASILSLSHPQLETLRESSPLIYRKVRVFFERPETFLATLIIANECLNILTGTLIAELTARYGSGLSTGAMGVVSVLLTSTLLLVSSEIIPKILAFRFPVLTASTLIFPVSWAHWVLTPFRKIFEGFSSMILRLFGFKRAAQSALSEKDLLTLVEVGAESGTLERSEKEMIYNVFQFSDLPVSKVMTPWPQVFTIPERLTVSEILNELRKKTFSRIPVVTPDNRVLGILYTKELLRFLLTPNVIPRYKAPEKAIFPPYIVSTHKKVSILFREFKTKKVHFALVVDEYGNHLGVVTLEDLLNALFKTKKAEEKVAT